MTVAEGPSSAGIMARAQNILLRPSAEWEVIAGESATTQGLFTGYACILAILPVIGALIAKVLIAGVFGSMLGSAMGGISMASALVSGVLQGVIGYAFNLAIVFVVGLIINALATSFDAKSDAIQALKVAVYSGTALWVAGLFIWVPLLGALLYLAALGYTCYLLYLGVAKVMQPPEDKAVVYTVVVIGAEIGLVLVAWIITSIIVGMVAIGGAVATGAALGGVH